MWCRQDEGGVCRGDPAPHGTTRWAGAVPQLGAWGNSHSEDAAGSGKPLTLLVIATSTETGHKDKQYDKPGESRERELQNTNIQLVTELVWGQQMYCYPEGKTVANHCSGQCSAVFRHVRLLFQLSGTFQTVNRTDHKTKPCTYSIYPAISTGG